MSKQKPTPEEYRLLWNDLEELHKRADLGEVKKDLLIMFETSILSEFMNDPKERHRVFFSFRHLYNFLLKAEMIHDSDILGVNLLSYGE